MSGNKTLKSKELSQQIGSTRLNFAPENKMAKYLDISPGAVSVLGLMNDKEKHVQLLVDEDIFNADYIACHPCVNTSSLKIKLQDILDTFLTSVHHDYQVVSLTTNQQ
jgi:Ala-tRNA(Pro) deacylase